jgi:LuxR family quorum sensing-dependent transcriptional regulator
MEAAEFNRARRPPSVDASRRGRWAIDNRTGDGSRNRKEVTPMHAYDLQKALTGLDHIRAATSALEVLSFLESALKPFGAEFFCLNFLPVKGQKFEEVLLVHQVPTAWMQLYLERQYSLVDPSLRHCRRTTWPFEYLESPYDRDSEPLAAEVLQRASDFGLSKGFLIPVASPTGRQGNVWIGGYDLKLAADEKSIVHLLSLYAFDKAQHFSGLCDIKPNITLREREVLTWIASGKTAWEIGQILNISKRTVDEHLAKAAHKLNAANRPQAVARAIRYRLIEP